MGNVRDTKFALWGPIALVLVVVLVALLAPRPGGTGLDRAVASGVLTQFDSCDELSRYVRRHDGGVGPGVLMPGAEDGAAVQQASAAEAPATGSEMVSSTDELTNVQEAGVDEPDIVKADGARVFAVAGNQLHVLVMDRGGLVQTATVELPGRSAGAERELLVSGDRVLVLGAAGGLPGVGSYVPNVVKTSLVEVDVSELEAPTVVRSARVDGGYVSARLNGTTARVVTAAVPSVPVLLAEEAGATAETGTTGATGPSGPKSSGEELLPRIELRDHVTGETDERPLLECSDVRYPQQFAGAGMLNVLTIDLEEGIDSADADTVMSSGDTVYASAESLYVATERWLSPGAQQRIASGDLPTPESQTSTEIHRFETGEAASTEYAGSGRVPGYMLSQWSMSEHEGVLRVASTTSPPWFTDIGPQSRSYVTVLEQSGGELEEVGRSEPLGLSEEIYAVRFVGELGFVVTFRQVDPLYTLDLSDPGDPHAVGELKVPGYSAYLHPVGEDLLMGVGQDATSDGMVQGSQISLFDVSDLEAPVQLDRVSLGPGTSSEVEYDHHAFTFDSTMGLAVAPLTSYNAGSLPGAVGIRVDGDELVEVGRASHPEVNGFSHIRRSLLIGDSLLTMSERGIAVHDPATLERESWVPFAGP